MTIVNTLKQALTEAARETTGAPSVGYDFDAYVRNWPFVAVVDTWDVWNNSKPALTLEVVRWLERYEDLYDFWQFRDGCGLIGFEDLKALTRFRLR